MFHILVVEDDKDLNRTVCSYLNQNGFEAKGAMEPEEAYDMMYETVFDLIISDIMMPYCDGFALARSIREINNEIPIIFMSARDDKPSKQLGYKIGIDDYIVKPIELDELGFKISAIARRLKINQKKELVCELEKSLEKYNISKLQRIKEDNYVRVFYSL